MARSEARRRAVGGGCHIGRYTTRGGELLRDRASPEVAQEAGRRRIVPTHVSASTIGGGVPTDRSGAANAAGDGQPPTLHARFPFPHAQAISIAEL